MAISVYEQLNSMGLNINRSTLQQVSASILKRAEEKNSQYKVDNTRNFFRKRDIGVDLYSGNVDLRLTKQIALNNSGLQIQLNQETLSKISYLNSMAAQNMQRNVEGKMTIAVNEITLKEHKHPVNTTNRIVAQETSKDKKGSNPFYNGELLMAKTSNTKEEIPTDETKVITTSVFF